LRFEVKVAVQRPAAEAEPAGSSAEIGIGADDQRPRVDRRAPGVSAVPGQRQRACATLGDRADAADHAGIGQGAGAVEHQRGVVDDVAYDAAGGAIADLQRAGADRRAADVGVGTGEDERTRTRLGQARRAGDDRGDGGGAARHHADGGTGPAQGQGVAGHDIAAKREIMRGDRGAQGYRTGGSGEHRIIERGIAPGLKGGAIEPERGGGVPGACTTAARSDAVGAPLQVGRIGADAPP